MMTERSTSFKHRYLAWAALLIAPAMLGARGCNVGVVGSECGGLRGEQCDSGQYCEFAPGALCGAGDQTGTCKDIPDFCTEQFDPVCGCDGNTYGNDCFAAAAGVSVASDGECVGGGEGEVCGGLLGASCSDGEFCDFPIGAFCGAADQTGVCEPIPEACTREFNPVCGCDGITYSNPCLARAAGQSVASEGECEAIPPSGTVCGGLQGGACADGEFCNIPPEGICGAADATGICEPIPQGCTREFNPVCGCDGITYSNPCLARAAGQSIVSEGECAPQGGGDCGGLAGLACPDGQFCSFPAEAVCGAADATGVCAVRPDACTLQFDPVCGCDGNTYGNACSAASAGVSVASLGECEQTGSVCGGLIGAQCADGEFCNFSLDAACGAADQTGTCQAIPEVCTFEFNPVCGCDDQTYDNSCIANTAGVSVASTGACP